MKKIVLLLTVIVAVAAFAEEKNGIVYVKQGGTGTGTSWTDALGDIQTAINTARTDRATRKDVWVAAGNYTINTCVALSDSINVYGSFLGTETSVSQRLKVAGGAPWEFSYPTILTGNNVRLFETSSNFDMATVVDGFILTNGNAVGATLNNSGGAIVLRNNTILQNSVVKNSSALNGAGGGINLTGGTVKNCWIYNNKQTTNANGGGGIYINTASGNETTIENCKIESNSSSIRGGAINVQGAGNTFLRNLYIVNNKAEDAGTPKAGGAIYANSATNTVTNCIIANNSGLTSFYIRGSVMNCTMVNNIGGAYLAETTAAIEVSNNIFWGMFTDITETVATSLSGANNANAFVQNNATYNPIPTDKNWKISEKYSILVKCKQW
ncbi:MAG: right-handed parallel beta-helix repeat-containing protein [Paludibacteraceae bacterium]